MSEKAIEILKSVYTSYAKGDEYLEMKSPVSSEIHDFNMAVKEISDYIEFIERNMLKIKISLSEKGLEYCMEYFGWLSLYTQFLHQLHIINYCTPWHNHHKNLKRISISLKISLMIKFPQNSQKRIKPMTNVDFYTDLSIYPQ